MALLAYDSVTDAQAPVERRPGKAVAVSTMGGDYSSDITAPNLTDAANKLVPQGEQARKIVLDIQIDADKSQLKEDANRVEATVSAVSKVSVHIDCLVAQSTIEILVPTAVVPENLRRYGQAVWVCLSKEYGVRQLVVSERDAPQVADPIEYKELDDWVSSL